MTPLLIAALLAAAPKPAKVVPKPAAKEAADTAGPAIQHTPVAQATLNQEVRFEAEIDDPAGVFEPMIYWRLLGGGTYFQAAMEGKLGTRSYSGVIPASKVTGDIEYFLEAYDKLGNGPSRSGSAEKPLVVKAASGVRLIKVGPGEVGGPVENGAVGSAAEPPSPVAAMATTGGGVALIGVGAVLYLLAASTLGEIDGKYAKGAGRQPADYDAVQSAVTRGQIGSVLMIGGVVVTAGGTAWWLVGGPSSGGAALKLVARF